MKAVKIRFATLLMLVVVATAFGCGDDQSDGSDNNGVVIDTDTGSSDGGISDAGTSDAGTSDTGSADSGGGGTTGRTGLEGYCDHYVDCGGTYYADAEACIDASIDYWGECRRDELDTFGDCMMQLSCDEWGNPDAYNPASTSCSEEWSAVGDATCE